MKGGDDGKMRKRAKEYSKKKELEDTDISFNNSCCEDTQL